MTTGLFREANAYWISENVIEPLLEDRLMWTANYSYLYHIWCLALARVYESGMHGWWTAYRLSYYERVDKVIARKRLPRTPDIDHQIIADH